MRLYPRLFLRSAFEIVEVGDDTVAVSVGDDANAYKGVVSLKNESARFMFEKLQEGITLPELIKVCMDEYADSVEEVGPKVIEFLNRLRDEGLLAADPKHGIKVED